MRVALRLTMALATFLALATKYIMASEETGMVRDNPEVTAEPSANPELSEAEIRELGAEEDPQAASELSRQEESERSAEQGLIRRGGFDIYGSVRVRGRYQDTEWDLQDDSSRLGAETDWEFRRNRHLFARGEMGFNVLSGFDSLSNPGQNAGEEFQNSLFTRLLYGGVELPPYNVIFGKNWSSYYEVASFTDRFMGLGASASGTFNADTDGGPTGTGRADLTLQLKTATDFLPHVYVKPFDLNLQFQHGNDIPFANDARYGAGFGVSSTITTLSGHRFGLAYNYAHINLDDDPTLRAIGLDGSAHAALLGYRSYGERWYAGVVVSRLLNHETTDEGIYFDGWGSELYGQYQLLKRLWFVGGYNVLLPDPGEDQAGDYRVGYGIAGLRFTYEQFRRMVFMNVRLDSSRNQDGTSGSHVFTIGVRWDLSRRGIHLGRDD